VPCGKPAQDKGGAIGVIERGVDRRHPLVPALDHGTGEQPHNDWLQCTASLVHYFGFGGSAKIVTKSLYHAPVFRENPLQVVDSQRVSGGLVGIDQEVVTLRGPFGTTRVPARPMPGAPTFN